VGQGPAASTVRARFDRCSDRTPSRAVPASVVGEEPLELGARVDDHATDLDGGEMRTDVRVERLQRHAERRRSLRTPERERRHGNVDVRAAHAVLRYGLKDL
jgi:hypothetical protein